MQDEVKQRKGRTGKERERERGRERERERAREMTRRDMYTYIQEIEKGERN